MLHTGNVLNLSSCAYGNARRNLLTHQVSRRAPPIFRRKTPSQQHPKWQFTLNPHSSMSASSTLDPSSPTLNGGPQMERGIDEDVDAKAFALQCADVLDETKCVYLLNWGSTQLGFCRHHRHSKLDSQMADVLFLTQHLPSESEN